MNTMGDMEEHIGVVVKNFLASMEQTGHPNDWIDAAISFNPKNGNLMVQFGSYDPSAKEPIKYNGHQSQQITPMNNESPLMLALAIRVYLREHEELEKKGSLQSNIIDYRSFIGSN